jgi:hypothetical protein
LLRWIAWHLARDTAGSTGIDSRLGLTAFTGPPRGARSATLIFGQGRSYRRAFSDEGVLIGCCLIILLKLVGD